MSFPKATAGTTSSGRLTPASSSSDRWWCCSSSRRRNRSCCSSSLAATIILAIVALLFGHPDFLIFPAAAIVLALLYPNRAGLLDFLGERDRTNLLPIGLAIAAGLILLPEALDKLDLQRANVSGDEHAEFLHWSMGLILLMQYLLAGFLIASGRPGSRALAYIVGASMILPRHRSARPPESGWNRRDLERFRRVARAGRWVRVPCHRRWRRLPPRLPALTRSIANDRVADDSVENRPAPRDCESMALQLITRAISARGLPRWMTVKPLQ